VAYRVRFHPEAVEETQAAVDWYLQRSSDAAAGFVAELDHAIERIAELPETWPSYIDDTRRFVFRVYPFSVVYRVANELVEVVAVAHSKRKPGYWASRVQ
jgi:plasmid stabilization system protein ParE